MSEWQNITEEEFKAYEDVRKSGATNMFAVGVVCTLASLTREKVLAIMKNYVELCNKYPNVRKLG